MDSKKFTHSGKIVSINNGRLKVEFEAQGACGGCAARSKCGMVDSSKREVEVMMDGKETYNIGDSVHVAISYKMGMMSVLVAYVLPLILLIGTLVIASSTGVDDGLAAIISLAILVIYFIVVYLFRNKLDKQIKFTIEK